MQRDAVPLIVSMPGNDASAPDAGQIPSATHLRYPSRLASTARLQGIALDVAVAIAEGMDADGACLFHDEGRYDFSTNWKLGGPILEREGITLDRYQPDHGKQEPWVAQIWDAQGNDEAHEAGATPLIAAMRCYVAHKLGDEVELPIGCFAQ